MADFDGGKVQISTAEAAARRHNRRNIYVICGIATIAGMILAGALLIPSGHVIKTQLSQELANQNPPVASVQIGHGAAPELLEGTHGGTFIVGSRQGLIGTNMSAHDVVNRHDASAFRDGTFLFRNERVQTVPAEDIFSIGRTPADAVIVHVGPNTQRPLPGVVHEVSTGQNVAVSGQIKPMPSAYIVSHTWGVTAHQLARLGNTSIYIEANAVQLLKK